MPVRGRGRGKGRGRGRGRWLTCAARRLAGEKILVSLAIWLGVRGYG